MEGAFGVEGREDVDRCLEGGGLRGRDDEVDEGDGPAVVEDVVVEGFAGGEAVVG